MNNIKTISIVIPTLGGNSLKKPLFSILNSTYPINEIIIVIPKQVNFCFDLDLFKDLNIIILKTEKGGQVHQRSEGFKITNSEYIIQIDDDIQFNNLFIESLIKSYKSLPEKTALSPLMINRGNKSVYSNTFSLLSRLFYGILYFDFKLVEGSINSFGRSIGVITENKLIKTDWLPGGCVLHNKNNLIDFDYFPYQGKAFMEDLIHSYLLHLNGVQLYIDSNLKIIIEDPKNEINVNKMITNKIKELKIRKYYFNLTGLNLLKYYWSYIIDISTTTIKYIYFKTFEK